MSRSLQPQASSTFTGAAFHWVHTANAPTCILRPEVPPGAPGRTTHQPPLNIPALRPLLEGARHNYEARLNRRH